MNKAKQSKEKQTQIGTNKKQFTQFFVMWWTRKKQTFSFLVHLLTKRTNKQKTKNKKTKLFTIFSNFCRIIQFNSYNLFLFQFIFCFKRKLYLHNKFLNSSIRNFLNQKYTFFCCNRFFTAHQTKPNNLIIKTFQLSNTKQQKKIHKSPLLNSQNIL